VWSISAEIAEYIDKVDVPWQAQLCRRLDALAHRSRAAIVQPSNDRATLIGTPQQPTGRSSRRAAGQGDATEDSGRSLRYNPIPT
jgi:hypothetical protein